MIKTLSRKFFVVLLSGVLVLAALPVQSAFAASPTDTTPPPTPNSTQMAQTRLQLIFQIEQLTVDRDGQLLDKAPDIVARIQKLLDAAGQRGMDVSGIQSALDAFSTALDQAKPLHDQAVALVQSHNGFDAQNNVTDVTQARETVKSLHDDLQQFRTTLMQPLRDLRQAVQQFRQAHPRPTPTPGGSTPGGNGL